MFGRGGTSLSSRKCARGVAVCGCMGVEVVGGKGLHVHVHVCACGGWLHIWREASQRLEKGARMDG
jgi:hypothetical protein